MVDRPILFSAPMVRALLDGRKTQTRRVLKAVPPSPGDDALNPNLQIRHEHAYLDAYCSANRTPLNPRGMSNKWCWWTRDDRQCLPVFDVRFTPGDRLWVKESHRVASWDEDGGVWMSYDADGARSGYLLPPDEDFVERLCAKLDKAGVPTKENGFYGDDIPPKLLRRVSIHMPRWASRLTLTVTDVRVERLQSISDEDALAEGVYPNEQPPETFDRTYGQSMPVHLYGGLWDHINGAGAWDTNPWVVAVAFSVTKKNIDAAEKQGAAIGDVTSPVATKSNLWNFR